MSHVGVGWGGMGWVMVVHENNRYYSYLNQMQNDANFGDMNLIWGNAGVKYYLE